MTMIIHEHTFARFVGRKEHGPAYSEKVFMSGQSSSIHKSPTIIEDSGGISLSTVRAFFELATSALIATVSPSHRLYTTLSKKEGGSHTPGLGGVCRVILSR